MDQNTLFGHKMGPKTPYFIFPEISPAVRCIGLLEVSAWVKTLEGELRSKHFDLYAGNHGKQKKRNLAVRQDMICQWFMVGY